MSLSLACTGSGHEAHGAAEGQRQRSKAGPAAGETRHGSVESLKMQLEPPEIKTKTWLSSSNFQLTDFHFDFGLLFGEYDFKIRKAERKSFAGLVSTRSGLMTKC